MENKKILKILIPVLIIVVLAGMYIFKNVLNKPADTIVQTPATPTEASANNETPAESADVQLSGGSMPLSAEYDLEGWLAQGKPVLIEFGTES